jgi:predicted RNase H-like HicB family nuclease
MVKLPVVVSQAEGRFTARVLGEPEMRAEGSTRELALAELRKAILVQIGGGELLSMPLFPKGLHPAVGKFRDDPTIAELREEIYRARDAERNLEIET